MSAEGRSNGSASLQEQVFLLADYCTERGDENHIFLVRTTLTCPKRYKLLSIATPSQMVNQVRNIATPPQIVPEMAARRKSRVQKLTSRT